MRKALKYFLLILGVLVVCVPITLVITFLLVPLWRWVEFRFEVEAIGHSAPAEWCFYAVYAALVAITLSAVALLTFTRRAGKALSARH